MQWITTLNLHYLNAQKPKQSSGDQGPLLYLILLVRPVSGSTALTRPTVQAGGQFSDTSMWYRARENLGGSSASSTATLMEALSLKGPRRKKRGSTMGLRTSTEKE